MFVLVVSQCVGWSRGRLLLEAKAGPIGPSLRETEMNPSFQVGIDAPTVDVGDDVPSVLSDFRVKPAGTSSLDIDLVTSSTGKLANYSTCSIYSSSLESNTRLSTSI